MNAARTTVRLYASSPSAAVAVVRLNSTANLRRKLDWNRAVSDAEHIVGYPSSFLNLRSLFSDELANVALQRLICSKHPFLNTAKWVRIQCVNRYTYRSPWLAEPHNGQTYNSFKWTGLREGLNIYVKRTLRARFLRCKQLLWNFIKY